MASVQVFAYERPTRASRPAVLALTLTRSPRARRTPAAARCLCGWWYIHRCNSGAPVPFKPRPLVIFCAPRALVVEPSVATAIIPVQP